MLLGGSCFVRARLVDATVYGASEKREIFARKVLPTDVSPVIVKGNILVCNPDDNEEITSRACLFCCASYNSIRRIVRRHNDPLTRLRKGNAFWSALNRDVFSTLRLSCEPSLRLGVSIVAHQDGAYRANMESGTLPVVCIGNTISDPSRCNEWENRSGRGDIRALLGNEVPLGEIVSVTSATSTLYRRAGLNEIEDGDYGNKEEGKAFDDKALLFSAIGFFICGFVFINKGWRKERFHGAANVNTAAHVTLLGMTCVALAVLLAFAAMFGHDFLVLFGLGGTSKTGDRASRESDEHAVSDGFKRTCSSPLNTHPAARDRCPV